MAQIELKRKELPPSTPEAAQLMGIEPEEWKSIVHALGRVPNEFEIIMYATTWAEDNSQKSSDKLLSSLRESQQSQFKEEVKYSNRVPFRFVDIGEGQAITQIVLHSNRDTARTPAFGGSVALNNTLDEFISLGAKPLAFAELLRLGDYERPKTQRALQKLMDGVSRYTNVYGIPISVGDLYFHPSFNSTICANLGVLGIVDQKNLNELTKRPPLESPVLCLGYKTPPVLRDAQGKLKVVRLADPYMQNRLISIVSDAIREGLICDICPMAKGGIVRAAITLCNHLQHGMQLYVDKIPVEGKQMDPHDVLMNESSGRFLIVAPPERHRDLTDFFRPHGIDCTTVGLLSDSDDLELVANHLVLGNAPYRHALTGFGRRDLTMTKTAPMLRREEQQEDMFILEHLSDVVALEDVWVDILANPNLCSRRLLGSYFDQRAGYNLLPRAGADSALVLLPQGEGDAARRAVAIAMDSNSLYVSKDSYLGTVHCIAETMQNLAVAGARPQGMSYCINVGDPDDPLIRAQLSEATRAIDDVSICWHIPILAESVSAVIDNAYVAGIPTPTIMMFGVLPDLENLPTPWFKQAGDKVFVIGETGDDLAASEYAFYTQKDIARVLPDLDLERHERVCTLVAMLVRQGLVSVAHDISGGGLAIALSECAVLRPGKVLGVSIELLDVANQANLRREVLLFGETPGRFIVTCKPEDEQMVRAYCKEYGIKIGAQGTVGGKEVKVQGLIECSIPCSTIKRIWVNGLNHMFDVEEEED